MTLTNKYEEAKADFGDKVMEYGPIAGGLLGIADLGTMVITEPVKVTFQDAIRCAKETYHGDYLPWELQGIHGDWRDPIEKTKQAIKGVGSAAGYLSSIAILQTILYPFTAMCRLEEISDLARETWYDWKHTALQAMPEQVPVKI